MTSTESVIQFAKRRGWFSVLDLQLHVLELGATSADRRFREVREANPDGWVERWVKDGTKRYKQFRLK